VTGGVALAERTKWYENVPHGMGDTKRGRERQGQKKREQLREQEVERTLTASDDPPDPQEDEIEFGE
jgi:hypothetical protein